LDVLAVGVAVAVVAIIVVVGLVAVVAVVAGDVVPPRESLVAAANVDADVLISGVAVPSNVVASAEGSGCAALESGDPQPQARLAESTMVARIRKFMVDPSGRGRIVWQRLGSISGDRLT
jgi:hypothetical protein